MRIYFYPNQGEIRDLILVLHNQYSGLFVSTHPIIVKTANVRGLEMLADLE